MRRTKWNYAKRDTLVVQNLHLVGSTVSSYLKQFPVNQHLRDELIGEGMLKIVGVIEFYLSKPPGKNLRSLIQTAVWNRCRDVCRGENRHQAKLESLPESPAAYKYVEGATYQAPEPCPLAIRIFEACLDETDRMIVAFLREQKTVGWIAYELELPVAEVRHRKKQIGERAKQ